MKALTALVTGEREVALPHGQTLLVRPSCDRDLNGIQALYDGLNDDDRRRRFFSLYRPPASFFQELVHVTELGGLDLVALVSDAGSPGTVVAEAGYFPLKNGDGELAITICKAWRGWLGAYLLNVLVTEAGGRGVPNLEAEILVDNRAMLALVRGRGFATLSHEIGSSTRVLIGATTSFPSWPATREHPRVLVEAAGGWWLEGEARAAGMDVITCPGPRASGRAVCPAVAGTPCPLAAGADVIVCLPFDNRAAGLPGLHRALHPGARVFVQGSARSAASANGVTTLPRASSVSARHILDLLTGPTDNVTVGDHPIVTSGTVGG
jgi:hypothetical protein